MKNTYEDYVKPPSYKENQVTDNDKLMSSIRLRIQKDLNQINGVYDCQISECDQNKSKKIKQIELEYNSLIENINKKRKEDIDKYNQNVEKHIDSLISSMNNCKENKKQGWLDWVFQII